MPIQSIAVGQNADGRIQLFVGGSCHPFLYTRSQASPNLEAWGPWSALAWARKQCAIGLNADGRMEVFALNWDGKCQRFWQEKENGPLTGGVDIGAAGWEQIAMERNLDGRLELFALVAGNVYHLWQTVPNGSWSPSAPFGTVGVGQMAVARNADGRIEVFCLISGGIWHFWQLEPGKWGSSSQPFGTRDVSQMSVAGNADGRLEVFCLINGDIWHFWQLEPGKWGSPSQAFGTRDVSQMAVASNADGRLEVFCLIGGDIWHFWQLDPGKWGSPSQAFGTRDVSQMAVARNADGRLEVFCVAGDELWRFFQKTPGGAWTSSLQFPDPDPRPILQLSAGPDHINLGEAAELVWTSKYADGLVLEPGIGAVEPNGSRTVKPDRTTSYHLHNSVGSCTSTATATVTVKTLTETDGVLFSFVPVPGRLIFEGLVICQGAWGDESIAGKILRIHVPASAGDIVFLRPKDLVGILTAPAGSTINDVTPLTSPTGKSIPMVYAVSSNKTDESGFYLTLDYTA
jgi:hypothetical protein